MLFAEARPRKSSSHHLHRSPIASRKTPHREQLITPTEPAEICPCLKLRTEMDAVLWKKQRTQELTRQEIMFKQYSNCSLTLAPQLP
jgi:hypothetical protein